MGLCYFLKGPRKLKVVLPTKSLENLAVLNEFPARFLSSERFLGDPEAQFQIRSRRGKRRVNDRVLNMSEQKI